MTYSIVARDPVSGEWVWLCSRTGFPLGSVVPWGEPGVGVVATQAFADPGYGPRGLELMRKGKSAPDALAALVAADREADSARWRCSTRRDVQRFTPGANASRRPATGSGRRCPCRRT